MKLRIIKIRETFEQLRKSRDECSKEMASAEARACERASEAVADGEQIVGASCSSGIPLARDEGGPAYFAITLIVTTK